MRTDYTSFDLETYLIATQYDRGFQGAAPRTVCLTWAGDKEDTEGRINNHRKQMQGIVGNMLTSKEVLIGQNIAFDMVTAHHDLNIPLKYFISKYNRGRVRDTQVREILLATESGRLARAGERGIKTSLEALTAQYLGKDVSHLKKGEDAWRLRYAELDGVPLDEWPQAAIDYAIGDSVDTLEIFKRQGDDTISPDEQRQCRSAFDLRLLCLWAPFVDGERVEEFAKSHEKTVAAIQKRMAAKGLMTWMEKTQKYKLNTKPLRRYIALDYAQQGREVPLTEKGQVSTSKDTLLGCETKLLQDWGEAGRSRKLLEAFVPGLRECAGRRVTTNYNVLLKTGRTSSFKLNMQQQSKSEGHRECFRVADPENNVFVNNDFDSFEMFGLAQTVYEEFDNSVLLDVLNGGEDPHLMVVSRLTGEAYGDLRAKRKRGDKSVEAWRHAAKAFNFGGAGGMAAATFITTMSIEQRETLQALNPSRPLDKIVQESLNEWWDLWELEPLRQKAKRNVKSARCTYEQPITGRVRRGFTYCSYLNYHFQPRCADAAKRALTRVIDKIVERNMPVRPCIFVHDEIVSEGPVEGLADWTTVIQQTMMKAAREVLPDCEIGVGIEVTGTHWSKGGSSVTDYLKGLE